MPEIQIVVDGPSDVVLESSVRILSRELAERGGANVRLVSVTDEVGAGIILAVADDLPAESFELLRESDQVMRIRGGDSRGVLYGCGRFLRACRFENGKLRFPSSEGPSAPDKPMRGIYFALHMHNYYHDAPLAEVTRYIEEMALLGLNLLALTYPKGQFRDLNDPACHAFNARFHCFYRAARSVGMKTMLIVCANASYQGFPEGLGYEGDVPRNWGNEICPSKPGAAAFMGEQFETIFSWFSDLDMVTTWPYDSGGCDCETCQPWGAVGYPKAAELIARVFKKICPRGEAVYSTWYFDYNTGDVGEWDAFYEQLDSGRLNWADWIMADGAHVNGDFPQRVIDQPLSKPVIGFMEISMRTSSPWGVFGANPIPGFIEREWSRCRDVIEGGTPYSEGIYEDVNKFIWSQLCWSPDRPVREILEEYAAYEFSPHAAEQIAETMIQLETDNRRVPHPETENRIAIEDKQAARQIWETLEYVDRTLPRARRRSWRWRVLLLRGFIDAELARHDGQPTAALGRAYDELTELYHAGNHSFNAVRPYDVEADPVDGDGQLRFVHHYATMAQLIGASSETVDEEAITLAQG